MSFSETQKGEGLIFFEALLWSLFPVFARLSYGSVTPLVSLAWSTLFSIPLFALLLTIRNRWQEVKTLSALKDILLSTFFVGILFYCFYYVGLKYTTAGNASIVALMEFFFSYLFFNIWKKEYFSRQYTAGAVFMLLGALIILAPKHGGFLAGDWLVLLAAAIAPFGNYFQQRARKKVSSETIMFIRSMVSVPFIFGLSFLLNRSASLTKIAPSLPALIFTGVVLLGLSKILWIEAIHRISVVKANALNSIGPFFTLIFSFFILKEVPHVWQFLSLIPLIGGVFLLTFKSAHPQTVIIN